MLPLAGVGQLDAAFASRWLCAVCPMLLLPLRGRPTSEVLSARQALGKPVDHSFFDHVASTSSCTTSKNDSTGDHTGHSVASSPTPMASHQASTGHLIANEMLAPPSAENDALAVGLPVVVAAISTDGFQVRDTLPTAASLAEGDTVLSLLHSKLAAQPELRRHILSFHPSAAALGHLAVRTPLDVYTEFQTRTTPMLRSLPFDPAPLSALGRVAVIVEPRAEPSIVARTAYVLRNVCVMLNSHSALEDEASAGMGGGNRACVQIMLHVQKMCLCDR